MAESEAEAREGAPTRESAIEPVGHVGLGIMGLPMARNLLTVGRPVVAWNRSPGRLAQAAEAGERVSHDLVIGHRCSCFAVRLCFGRCIDSGDRHRPVDYSLPAVMTVDVANDHCRCLGFPSPCEVECTCREKARDRSPVASVVDL